MEDLLPIICSAIFGALGWAAARKWTRRAQVMDLEHIKRLEWERGVADGFKLSSPFRRRMVDGSDDF